jgi:hypothetical protein
VKNSSRPWFQLHLSTAIVLMFVAGGFIWANTVKAIAKVIHTPATTMHAMRTDGVCMPFTNPARDTPVFEQGWPATFRSEMNAVAEWRYKALACDVAALGAILLAFTVLCEYFFRRREARAQ